MRSQQCGLRDAAAGCLSALKAVRPIWSVGTDSYLLVLILGAFVGFVSGAYLADGIGRKATFTLSAIGSVVLILVCLFAPLTNNWILLVGFLPGYVITVALPLLAEPRGRSLVSLEEHTPAV